MAYDPEKWTSQGGDFLAGRIKLPKRKTHDKFGNKIGPYRDVPETEEVNEARKGFVSDLPVERPPRCESCVHLSGTNEPQMVRQLTFCKRINIYIDDTRTSRCPLFTRK